MASINLLYTKTHPKKVNVWVWLVNSESLTAYIALGEGAKKKSKKN